MNRDIKFRVWNTVDKVMYYPKNSMLMWNNNSWAFHGSDNPQDVRIGWKSFGDNKNAILQQFTGLKDKNGKDIYEGDICIGWRFGSNEDGKKYPFKVEWCQLNAGDDMDLDSYGFHFNPYYNEYEIIGNIFENPELLEKHKL